jgi:uncharacterized phage infection (PIP) family protein YhgE
MSKSYKNVPETNSVGGALSAAADTIRELAEEMGEWRDNMGENDGLRETEKFSAVEEAADTLEGADVDTVEEIPDECGDADDCDVSVALLQNKNKRRSNARWARLANALIYLEGASSALNAKMESLQSEIDEIDEQLKDVEDDEEQEELETKQSELEDQKSAIEDFVSEIDNVISEVEGVEFPGMFG